MTDFTFWRSALAGKATDIHADHPQPGFYKKRKQSRDSPWIPVAIWNNDDGTLVCRVANEMADPLSVWTYCAGNPVSKADADCAFKTGSWPGDAPTVGHNSAAVGNDYDGIKAEIDDYSEMAEEFLSAVEKAGGIKTKADADKASNMADALGNVKGGLARKADELRDAAVRPHLEAQRTINGRFNPMIDAAKKLADRLRAVSGAWTRAEQARLQKIADEEARKAREAAEAKAYQERDAWERQRAANLDSHTDLLDHPPVAPVIVAEKVKVSVGGQRAARRSLRTVRIAKVTDHAAALAYFATAQPIIDAVAKLAQQAVDAKMPTPPGVEVVEEHRL